MEFIDSLCCLAVRHGASDVFLHAERPPQFRINGELATIGKAYSGLTDIEIAELTPWFLEHRLPAERQRVKARASDQFGWKVVELPSRQVQLYFRDPAGNLIELNYSDADLLDRSRYPEMERLADRIPQRPESLGAALFI